MGAVTTTARTPTKTIRFWKRFSAQREADRRHYGAALVVANWLIGYHMVVGKIRAAATATQPAHGPT